MKRSIPVPFTAVALSIAPWLPAVASAASDELQLKPAYIYASPLPGARGSSFGAGVSRPVIRGMDGARVKVLSDGIDVLDASTLSADHAVTTEPLLLQQIEVLKGPATLLYGGGAVGGVVNLLDRKIPTQLPEP